MKKKSNPLGIENTKERLSRINQLYEINSTINIEDLYIGKDAKKPRGTKVTIGFPVNLDLGKPISI